MSRQNWPGSPAHVQFGSVRSEYKQPAIGRVFSDRTVLVKKGRTTVVWLRTPAQRFGARVVVDRKFVPRDIDPRSSDPRVLGAQVDYRFFKKLPPGVTPRPGG